MLFASEALFRGRTRGRNFTGQRGRIALFEESVVATTVAVASVTKANTNGVRMNSFCMATPVRCNVYADKLGYCL